MKLFLILICAIPLCCSFHSTQYDYIPKDQLADLNNPMFNGSTLDSTKVKLISKIEDEYFFIRLENSAVIQAKLEVVDDGVVAKQIKVIYDSGQKDEFDKQARQFSHRIPWEQIREIFVMTRYD